MPTMKTQRSTARKSRGGVVGVRVVLALIILVVVRAGGPLPLAHDVASIALAILEAAGCLAGAVAAAALAALVVRLVCLRWRDRAVHVITDAAWPRVSYTTTGGR
jgi:hypothetical protein